ncbi:MAG TPA: ATP synthase F1 subunit gamma [Deltaproteobacteria bacterium]|nr:ATP synthase F1 subunit gamma [Deltaproteobacteria bacterium]
MATLRDIKRRIKSVKNTQQITKAMKMVSAAKLRRAQEDITSARPYAEKIKGLVSSLASRVMPESNEFLSKAGKGRALLAVFVSDRGLCGGFNTNLIRKAERFVEENPELNASYYLVGRRAHEHYKRRGVNIVKTLSIGIARPSYGFAQSIAEDLIKAYKEDQTDEVYIIYSEFRSALSQRPVIERVLPLATEEEEEKEEKTEGILFEPSEEEVLAELLPKYVEFQVYRALLETAASEHGARMTAMDAATRNAGEMINKLTLDFNRARQAAITKELMEIISGAEALKG